jgi:calcium binding protein 39
MAVLLGAALVVGHDAGDVTLNAIACTHPLSTNKPRSEAKMSSDAPRPFEWLSGGLFFGKGKGTIDSVSSCNDVQSLISGINENLTAILAAPARRAAPADASPTTPTTAENISAAAAAATTESDNPQGPDKFLEARLSRLRSLLYDERRESSQTSYRKNTPAVAGAAMQALTGTSLGHLIPKLLANLSELPFESRKHVAAIFNYLLVCGLEGSDGELYQPIMIGFREYVEIHFDELLTVIVKGHECTTPGASDVGLHCGSMYRSCFKHVSVYRQLVSSTVRVERFILPFLDKYVHMPNFDIASDAMESVRLVFTPAGGGSGSIPLLDEVAQQEMAELTAEFLNRDYEAIWDERFNPKLLSDQANYMIRRIALQILSMILLTRSNYAVMIRYVNSRNNLILVMRLLRDTSPHISLDAFHVFKVFVANPNKIADVVKILQDNREKLCNYLQTLHQDKEASDTQFRDEKALIIATIQSL